MAWFVQPGSRFEVTVRLVAIRSALPREVPSAHSGSAAKTGVDRQISINAMLATRRFMPAVYTARVAFASMSFLSIVSTGALCILGSMTQAVIFDCFGVLYTSSMRALESMAPPERVQELRDAAAYSDYGGLTRLEFAAVAGEIVGKSAAEVEEIINTNRHRDTVLVDYVRELRGRGYKTAMLSNIGSDAIERLFTNSELEDLFDVVVLSYQVKLIKPDPQIFDLTAKRLQVAPADCIMVDDLADNCAGAESAGMRSVTCVSAHQTISDLDILLDRDKQ